MEDRVTQVQEACVLIRQATALLRQVAAHHQEMLKHMQNGDTCVNLDYENEVLTHAAYALVVSAEQQLCLTLSDSVKTG